MASSTDFSRSSAATGPTRRRETRVKTWREFVLPLAEKELEAPGGPLHGLRHSVLPHRLPGE